MDGVKQAVEKLNCIISTSRAGRGCSNCSYYNETPEGNYFCNVDQIIKDVIVLLEYIHSAEQPSDPIWSVTDISNYCKRTVCDRCFVHSWCKEQREKEPFEWEE